MSESEVPLSQTAAEYAMALDLCSRLTLVLDESRVLEEILEIFSTLFAPKRIIFHVMTDGNRVLTLTSPPAPAAPPPAVLPPGTSATTPAGFRVVIPYKDETVGIVEVDGIAFPEYRERYLSLALTMAGVMGLSVVNARTHRRLEIALDDLHREHDQTLRLDAELKAINEQLEARVRERTRELEDTARHLAGEVEQRKAAEDRVRSQLDEKTLLLRELHHRVKNNLQLIMSILSLQARKVPDPAISLALSESRNRIRTISVIHESLWNAQDLSRIGLDGLVRQIPASLIALYHVPAGKVAITFDIPQISVDINTAIPLGLALNELFANALKHAFPGSRTGAINVSIRDTGEELVLCVSDNGVGIPAGYDWENAGSVGLVLVTSLVDQLQGTISRDAAAGTSLTIRIPRTSAEPGSLRGTYNEIPAPRP